jgi:hypothetical protein
MQLLETTRRIGKRLQRICLDALMFSVSIGGKKYSTLVWLKVPGQRMKIEWSLCSSKKKGLRNGLKLLPLSMVVSGSNAESVGTIT